MGGREKETEYCLDWCPSRMQPAMMVVGCGREHVCKIYHYDDATRRWVPREHLRGHEDTIHDIAWAPSCGRSYQLIATACKDKRVRIFKLTPAAASEDSEAGKRSPGSLFDVQMVAELPDHGADVWRVQWNLTGTILSSSGDDGRVMLWKSNVLDEWTCMSVMHVKDQRIQAEGQGR